MDSLRWKLAAPASVSLGASVAVAGTVENATDRDLTLYLRGREPTFDLEVADAAGGTVWRRLHDSIVPAVLRVETLAPGAALAFAHTWDQRSNAGAPVPRGEYALTVRLLLETGEAPAPVVRVLVQ